VTNHNTQPTLTTNTATTLFNRAVAVLPGVALTALIAWFGLSASVWIGESILGFENSPVSGIMMAIVIGLIIGNLFVIPAWIKTGVNFSVKTILRLGVILLGIRLSLSDVLHYGSLSLPLVILCISGALLMTNWLGKRLRLSQRMTMLVAVGTSVCGATAIIATGPAIDASDEELTYAIANITLFGVLATLVYPFLAHALFGADSTGAGLFLGASIHDTAQVAGSGLIYAELFNAHRALEVAAVTKLIRNVFIAFIVPYMAYRYHQQSVTGEQKAFSFFALFPTFILGFMLMATIRSVGDFTLESGSAWGLFDDAQWSDLLQFIRAWSENFLAIAMAGVGLGTGLRTLRTMGIRPFYVGFGASITVGVLSVAGIGVLNLIGAY
jgi:uncharacterized integral membrane protein (TIGR00698 family)